MERFKIDDFGEAIRSDAGEFCSYVDAQVEIARLSDERDAAFAAGIEAAAQAMADYGSSFGGYSATTPDEAAEEIRAIATTNQRAALDKLVAERDALAAELAKRGEPVAWQHLKDGIWVECSEFVAKGWGDRYGPIYARPLYAHPAPASAGVTVKLDTEDVAKLVYDAMVWACYAGPPPQGNESQWTPGGNSLGQTEARATASRILAALSQPAQGGEGGA